MRKIGATHRLNIRAQKHARSSDTSHFLVRKRIALRGIKVGEIR